MINYQRVFKCIAYVYIPNQKRKEFDGKRENCIFLDISDNYKAYKLYNPNIKKIMKLKFKHETMMMLNKIFLYT